jgi:hypothetical protein
MNRASEHMMEAFGDGVGSPEHETLDRVCRGVASTQEGQQAWEIIQAMLKDAARYEFLRENIGRLIVSTSGHSVVLVGVNMNLGTPDPQTLDRAIDAAIEREEENERSAALGDQQDDLSGPAAQRRGL